MNCVMLIVTLKAFNFDTYWGKCIQICKHATTININTTMGAMTIQKLWVIFY